LGISKVDNIYENQLLLMKSRLQGDGNIATSRIQWN